MRYNFIKPIQTQIDQITIVCGRPLYIEHQGPDDTELKERILNALKREFAENGGLKIFNPSEN